jgi:hypothetical protein
MTENQSEVIDSAEIFYRRHSKSGADVDDKFDVVVDSKMKIILFSVFGVFMLGLWFYPLIDGNSAEDPGLMMEWWPPLVFILCTIPAILLWGKLGPAIAQKITLNWVKKTKDKEKVKPHEIIIGFPGNTKDPYFVEANPMDFDIKNPKIFISRVKDAIFLSIGISFMLAQTIAGAFPDMVADQVAYWEYYNEYEMLIYMAIFLGPMAMILLFFVLPLMWINQDMQIYRIDEQQDPYKVGFYVQSGPLSKILNFFGIILAFNTCNNFAMEFVGEGGSMVDIYTYTFIYFGYIIIACGAIPYLVSLVYLLFFHQEWVNTTRIKASLILPCASYQVNKVKEVELEYLTHEERISEFDKPDFSDKTPGKIVIIALAVVSVVICLWLGVWVKY